ncbi:hypothetical protein GHT09_014696 [Marmota monax]|uniref:Uncharacterized protein n=1 Tax=Marmota monax TaxID=9995 RepID=A0A834PX47_MARMO|nr:hypothetical protein GHT09_014696 [Marmota monax]
MAACAGALAMVLGCPTASAEVPRRAHARAHSYCGFTLHAAQAPEARSPTRRRTASASADLVWESVA